MAHEDCGAIEKSSCVRDPDDYKMRCLCGNDSPPDNGLCPDTLKGNHVNSYNINSLKTILLFEKMTSLYREYIICNNIVLTFHLRKDIPVVRKQYYLYIGNILFVLGYYIFEVKILKSK